MARIDPVMDAAELSAVLDDHYEAQAQTLTASAEASLLKFGDRAAPRRPSRPNAGRS